MLRPLLKQILVLLAHKSLDKHGPEVIVVTGNGQTSVAREAIYTVLKTKYPTRRNIEIPETEFSIPLFILGAKLYPQHTFEWIQTIIKTAVQLTLVKSHKHFLILEISDAKKEIAEFWLKIIQPTVLIICGKTVLNLENLPQRHPELDSVSQPSRFRNKFGMTTFYTKEDSKRLKPYFKITKKIGEQFGISEKEAGEALKNFEMPPQRIRILVGEKGQMIIDSTYHYSPPPLESVLEIADKFKGKKILITDYPKDKSLVSPKYQVLELKDALPTSHLTSHTLIIRGRKTKTRKLLENLTGRLQP